MVPMRSPQVLNGVTLSADILDNLVQEMQQFTDYRAPCLSVVLVGENTASKVYVDNKKKACAKIGFESVSYCLDENVNEKELILLIDKLNQDKAIDGILVQLPLPPHINSNIIVDHIAPHKDVDGFHRYNIGSLALNQANITPCTPHGIMYMLDSIKTIFAGLRCVVIGSSNIVGRPMALELINRGATVTICNSKTIDLPQIVKTADLIVVAVGKPKFVKANWIKPGAIVIDVGISRLDNGNLCGDVDYENVMPLTSYITPVPGGVGPMTIAMLMSNTMFCYKLNLYAKKR